MLIANRGEIAIRVMRAERDGVIQKMLARPGLQVDAKDLLVVFG